MGVILQILCCFHVHLIIYQSPVNKEFRQLLPTQSGGKVMALIEEQLVPPFGATPLGLIKLQLLKKEVLKLG